MERPGATVAASPPPSDPGGPGEGDEAVLHGGAPSHLIADTCLKADVERRVFTLHSDRPRVSNNNPYSEAHVKTVKYHPAFPVWFDDAGAAREYCRRFFMWYNAEHRHGGIGLLTPEQVRLGLDPGVIDNRPTVLAAAHAARPDRFVSGSPQVPELLVDTWINRALLGSNREPQVALLAQEDRRCHYFQ